MKLPILKDKNGIDIPVSSTILGTLVGHTKKHYFRFGLCSEMGKQGTSYEMFSVPYGYVHEVTQKDLVDFELTGKFSENRHLTHYDERFHS